VIARTPSGRIPFVRQFRPAVDCETWEFPSGLLEPGETPESCCRRELLEEASVSAKTVTCWESSLRIRDASKTASTCSFVDASEPDPEFVQEGGSALPSFRQSNYALENATAQAIERRDCEGKRITNGTFIHQVHLGAERSSLHHAAALLVRDRQRRERGKQGANSTGGNRVGRCFRRAAHVQSHDWAVVARARSRLPPPLTERASATAELSQKIFPN
jgi:ADP-ribose pyrophosphatase YjhB (NUDIX family)